MEQVVILASVAFLGNKIVELVKWVRAKDWNAAITLIVIHITGVIVMLFAAAAKVTETLVVPGTSSAIGDMDTASVIFIGLVITSLSSKLYDFQKAFDHSDTAAQPPLITNTNPAPTP